MQTFLLNWTTFLVSSRNSLYYDTNLLVCITKRSILNTKRLRRSHSPTFKICGKVRLSHLNLIIQCWINTRTDNRLGYFSSIMEFIAHQKMPNVLEVPLDPICASTSKFSHPSIRHRDEPFLKQLVTFCFRLQVEPSSMFLYHYRQPIFLHVMTGALSGEKMFANGLASSAQTHCWETPDAMSKAARRHHDIMNRDIEYCFACEKTG